ncbi:phosphodiester glycosidase family protein [Alkaliphilus peptidifermentans]|uniref:S-layer homology domain-containing protein n=1 Tax=Alkaliphilus peptidifermentans DSM 18978 TaxID=1120976 RepID=A0A1G5EVZ4_9FIRM|nr:phosphodiester glycosidase family protein [Alkaliphilus peptidifermentans]SCY31132.1 S-layer homology domain-containing protein [Alkaliphilus peptidifermentans DSM 18978]
MKKKIVTSILVLTIIFALLNFETVIAETSYQQMKINLESGQKTVNIVTIDLKDENIDIRAFVAGDKVMNTKGFKDIVDDISEEYNPLVVVNGTYFHAYSDNQPVGHIKDGDFLKVTNRGSAIGFTSDNNVKVDNLHVNIIGILNEVERMWYPWNFNHIYDSNEFPTTTVIYTPDFGEKTHDHSDMSIIVEDNIVIEKKYGSARIPENGFTIVTSHDVSQERIKIGDSIEYRLEYSQIDYSDGYAKQGNPIDWRDVTTAVGAGPSLVRDGKIVINKEFEGFSPNERIFQRAQRSFIGVTENDILIIGTVASVTLEELAEICNKLDLIDAINLDGGASSGLYHDGNYITMPGRQLNNVLAVVTRKHEDIPSDWAKEHIKSAEKNKLTTEKVMSDFRRDITREEFAELVINVYKALSNEELENIYKSPFNDTDNVKVLHANKLGIVQGVSENKFEPEKSITRQEISVMLFRLLNILDENNKKVEIRKDFTDLNDISPWALDAVMYLNNKGILQGVGKNEINPLGNTSREQAIILIDRIFKELNSSESTNK